MLRILTILLLSCLSLGCGSLSHAQGRAKPVTAKQQEIVLLFDNDVHGHVEGYPKISALRAHTLTETPHVTLISLGDFSQGGVYCAASKGMGITTLMNKAGYDLATVGNHEFDYGMEQFDSIIHALNAEVICCNLEDLRAHKPYLAPSTIRTYGNVRIGFIGMVAPLTETNDSPKSYYDESGKKIFSFHSGDLFRMVQREVNKLRKEGVDYVIALSHLGDNSFLVDNSIAMINRTHGIDVVLDSHSHSFIPNSKVINARGDSVLMISTGCWFKHIGKLTITPEGKFIPEMIPTEGFNRTDATIALTIDSLQSEFEHTPVLAHSDFQLYGFDIAETYDRNNQTNLGTLASDALRITTGADIGWINAGGIRQSIPAGDIRFKDLITTFPFFNTICVAECTGQVILDALEYGVNRYPYDFGSFPQVSGIKYAFDPSIPSPVMMDVQERLVGFKEGRRRISNVRVLDPFTGSYEPLDPQRTYTIASIDYLLKHHGAGDVFNQAKIVQDGGFNDVQNLEEYLVLELFGHVGEQYEFVKKDMDK